MQLNNNRKISHCLQHKHRDDISYSKDTVSGRAAVRNVNK